MTEQSGLFKESQPARQVLALALVGGLLLRLIPAFWGDLDPGGDGLQRLTVTAQWAVQPHWLGLSGLWPPLHYYVLGSLTHFWEEPVWLARMLNLAWEMATLSLLYAAVRPLYGDLVAALSALILAFNWTHIWLVSSYWVEVPYLLFVFAAIYFAQRTQQHLRAPEAWLAGGCLALALLLRHEGMILIGLFLLWFVLNVKSWRLLLIFASLPLLVASWHFIEPWLHGRSYFDYALAYTRLKAGENVVQGYTLKDRLMLIATMPAVAPSVVVILSGLYGLWLARRAWRKDLFAWLLAAQVIFFMVFTFTAGWRPQLRYVLIYFVNLFPAAALAWAHWMRRWRPWPVLLSLLTLTVAIQSVGWWAGRNEWRAGGWLPLRVRSAAQVSLDEWAGAQRERIARTPQTLKLSGITSGSLSEPWRLPHSLLLNRVSFTRLALQEFNAAYEPALAAGQTPPQLAAADVVLIDPQAAYAAPLLQNLQQRVANVQVIRLHPHVAVWLLSPLARDTFK